MRAFRLIPQRPPPLRPWLDLDEDSCRTQIFSSRSGASRRRLGLKRDEPLLGIGQDGEIRVGILPEMQKALIRFAGRPGILASPRTASRDNSEIESCRGRSAFRTL